MYLTNSGSHTYYTASGEQHSTRGLFLILAVKSNEPKRRLFVSHYANTLHLLGDLPVEYTQKGPDGGRPKSWGGVEYTLHEYMPIYAAVRKVAMTQSGHFMLGKARIGSVYIDLSGEFGNDGMPCSAQYMPHLTDALVDNYFTALPDVLVARFWGNNHEALLTTLSSWARTHLLYSPNTTTRHYKKRHHGTVDRPA